MRGGNFCKRGHRWTEENTYWRPNGGRVCRACASYRNLRRYWKRRLDNAVTKAAKEAAREVCEERGYL